MKGQMRACLHIAPSLCVCPTITLPCKGFWGVHDRIHPSANVQDMAWMEEHLSDIPHVMYQVK